MTGKQAFPSSITGNGSEPAGSVLDHGFGAGDPYTLGVEEEYQLLDPETFDLVQHIETMLAAVTGHELEARINAELMQSVLEIATPVCRNAGDVMRWLTTLRGYVTEIAHEQGTRVGSAGNASVQPLRAAADHREGPLPGAHRPAAVRRPARAHLRHARPRRRRRPGEGDPGRQRPAPASRSAPRAVGELAVLARRGDRVSRRAGRWSSPRSHAPVRRRASATTRTTRRSSGQLENTGCIADYTHIWWDIRLHPRLGTIEIRICDAVTRVEDAVAIAAYCQALVKQLCEQYEAGEEIPSYHRILTSENKWLAARYGLEAPVMDLATGSRNRQPVARLIRRTVKELRPHAAELGSERELEGISAILARGSSADRQLRVFNASRDITEVARAIADATEALPASVGSPIEA